MSITDAFDQIVSGALQEITMQMKTSLGTPFGVAMNCIDVKNAPSIMCSLGMSSDRLVRMLRYPNRMIIALGALAPFQRARIKLCLRLRVGDFRPHHVSAKMVVEDSVTTCNLVTQVSDSSDCSWMFFFAKLVSFPVRCHLFIELPIILS